MILQALTRYYDILSKDSENDIAPPGYSAAGVSFALNISDQGELLDIFSLITQVQRGKNLVDMPRRMIVPEQVKKTSGIASNFLCENTVYALGISNKKEDPGYAAKRFEAFCQLHKDLLSKADCSAARAVIAFLDRYGPLKDQEHPAINNHLDTLLKGGNLVFMFQGQYVHEDPAILQVWEAYKAGKEAVLGQCLVTGETAPIARLHASLKGIRDANSTGATLVGFNARAYESYNREKGQGLNAPVSEKATFAYTTALNYLLSSANPNKKIHLGDTTVVYWAESENKRYATAFSSIFSPEYIEETVNDSAGQKKAEKRLGKIAEKVRRVQALDISRITEELDPNTRFYVLGLTPNIARISVRFFITDPFGKIIERITRHYIDLEIVKEYEDDPTFIPLWEVLRETVSKKAKDQDAAPLMAGAVLRSILSGASYPAALYYAIFNRIRADTDDKDTKKINYRRAAIIKAFLIRKYRNQTENPIKEVLVMSLNEKSNIPAYVLGRLFAVLEKVQQEAIGSVNASIKDRYFTSACASPASVFPVLLRLSQHHISKAEFGYASDRRIQDILNLLDIEKNPIPARLSLDEQGIFVLGYYHQRAAFFIPKGNEAAAHVK